MKIKIGDKNFVYPIIQGGMGVGISLGSLSGHVAKNDAMGTISAVGIGFREEDFYENPFEANKRALRKEIRKAREISGGRGLLGVNVMVAVKDFEALVRTASEEDVDFIVCGAGLPLNLPDLVKPNILIAPIVSGVRSLKVILKYWQNKYGRTPDFIVLEGKNAGGHLGFKSHELKEGKSLLELTKEVISYLEKEDIRIPVFVAGSVFDGKDLKRYRKIGAAGIQIGSRFIASGECDVDENFKNLILESKKQDLRVIKSPVGMPARAINNNFLMTLNKEDYRSKKCLKCLKTCSPKDTEYCIMERLLAAARGDVREGLFFAGVNIDRINKIESVESIIENILEEGLK